MHSIAQPGPEVGRVVGVAFGNGMYDHPRSMEWAEGQRLACVGARGRPLRLGLRCLSLQFTSPSARFCVATFISGSKVLHTLAPWWSGTRRYTYWGSAVFLLFSESRGGRGEVGPRGVFSFLS